MFNNDLKKEAIKKLEDAIANNEEKIEEVKTKKPSELFKIRQKSAGIIQPAEDFVNQLANTPKEFDKTFSVFEKNYQTFKEISNLNFDDFIRSAFTSSAIASLFGVLATNVATLSALSFGGAATLSVGGMTVGSRLLALAGPIGIGISAVTLVGSGLYASKKNKKIAENVHKTRAKVENHLAELKVAIVKIHRLIDLTDEHQNGVSEILLTLKSNAPNDYQDYSSTQKNFLASLINHVQSLSKLLNKKVQ